MIQISDESKCCGCMACVQVCPKQCISTRESKKGFLYPIVNKDICIGCNLCEKVCPFNSKTEERKPIHTFAAKHFSDSIRTESSSGGAFTALAEQVIAEGGIVFGAMYDNNWQIVHGAVDNVNDLKKLRGSKYVQSAIGDTYIHVKKELKNDRLVLFSGTACQISGLKHYLRKDYDNLLTVDVICHGTPSPGVWRDYLNRLMIRPKGVVGGNSVLLSLKEKPVLTGISFRDKTNGWRKYGFVLRGKSAFKADRNTVLSSVDTQLLYEQASKNLYLRSFIDNYTLRPSCYNCPSKGGRSMSDITLADCWGIWKYHKDYYDDVGVSAILVNTPKGLNLLRKTKISTIEIKFSEVYEFNKSYSQSVSHPRFYRLFWFLYPFFKIKTVELVYLLRPRYMINKLLKKIRK